MLLDLIAPTLDAEAALEFQHATKGDDVPWVDLPSPPAPTGYDQFPAERPNALVGKRTVPKGSKWTDDSIPGTRVTYEPLSEIEATAFGHWKFIVGATATLEVPFAREEGVEIGASKTTEFSVGMSITVGATIKDLIMLGGELTTMYRHSQTVSVLYTTKQTFTFMGSPGVTKVTGCGWQADFVYNLFIPKCLITINGQNPIVKKNLLYTMPSLQHIFSTSQYPPAGA